MGSCTAMADADFQPILDAVALCEVLEDDGIGIRRQQKQLRDLFGKVLTTGLTVNVEDCHAREASDKEMVLEHIRNAIGTEKLNETVSAMLSPSKFEAIMESLLRSSEMLQEWGEKKVQAFRALLCAVRDG